MKTPKLKDSSSTTLLALADPALAARLDRFKAEQADAVSATYAAAFVMQPATQREDWVRLEGARRP